jgi:hypothetical protein
MDDIYLGNGVSELIVMAMNACSTTATRCWCRRPTTRCGPRRSACPAARRVHYLCDEGAGWMPDLADIRAKITPRTRAIVIINPNNPTGALYPDEVLQGNHRDRAPARPDHLCRRGLRQGAVRRRRAHLDRLAVRGRADHHLQRPVEELPLLRLPRRLDGGLRRQEACARLHRRPRHAGLDAPVRQRAGPVGHPDRAGRLPEHRRPGGAGRPPVPPARPGP